MVPQALLCWGQLGPGDGAESRPTLGDGNDARPIPHKRSKVHQYWVANGQRTGHGPFDLHLKRGLSFPLSGSFSDEKRALGRMKFGFWGHLREANGEPPKANSLPEVTDL